MKNKKIRSYNKTDKCFYYILNGGYFNREGEIADRWKFDWDNAEDSTCLRDKNGKEIFEGDIISPCCISASVTHCVVIFVNGMFCKKQIGSELFEEELFLHLHYSEVIGNIHENPELMEAI